MAKKILIVDDNELNRILLCKTLQNEYDIIQSDNGKDALEQIQKEYESLSAVLLDIIMPEMDGFEVLRSIRYDVKFSRLPVIMVTGSEDEESRTKALLLGANDFIQKPYNPDIIKHCLRNNISLYETATKLNAMQKDKITGLLNREAFFEKVTEMIASHDSGYYLISSFDIDNFKLINAQFGTSDGDRILREIGKKVQEDMDIYHGVAGRISSDNFAVLLPVKYKDVGILRILSENRFAFSDKQAVTFSVGRYIIDDLSLPAGVVYERAYIAKLTVKGRYDEHLAYFDNSMLERLVHNQRILDEVDTAVVNNQFEVWYQPQRNHITGALVGAEALVRWRHPQIGLVPPFEFVPLFEQNGFIYELDKYVWNQTCADIRRWIDEGREPVPVSVNISRYDIFRNDFIETISGLVTKYELPIELLRVEITESAFAVSTNHIVSVIEKLIKIGFIVEIDDFGSGYSSLNTLKSVPAQVVKLDMRFLADDNDAERGGNILSSIVRMAKWLGMSVIAEGVEEKAQADYLASIGCSYIQGYYYSKPLYVTEYEKYCDNLKTEAQLHTMDALENLDNNAFWDPKSMDTMIFNSYVGGACIFEYYNREIELLRANRKFAAILGDNISIEDTLKLDWISCLAPESRTLVRDVLKRSCETKEEYTNEYVFYNIPGGKDKIYLRGTMRVIATAGERLLVYCTSENITAQREAEESRLLAEAQLTDMMDDMPGGLVRVMVCPDRTIKPVYYNQGFMKLTGMSREELSVVYGQNVLNGIHPDDIDAVNVIAKALLQSGETHSSRYRIRHVNGGYFWVSTFERATIDKAGNEFINIYYADITNQVRQEELQKSLMDNLPCGAGVYEFKDGQMSLVYQNKVYWEMVGLNEEAYPDSSSMSAIHPDDIPIVFKELSSAIENNHDVVCDIRLRHLTKGYCPVRLMGRILHKDNGSFLIYATFTPNNK